MIFRFVSRSVSLCPSVATQPIQKEKNGMETGKLRAKSAPFLFFENCEAVQLSRSSVSFLKRDMTSKAAPRIVVPLRSALP